MVMLYERPFREYSSQITKSASTFRTNISSSYLKHRAKYNVASEVYNKAIAVLNNISAKNRVCYESMLIRCFTKTFSDSSPKA